MYLQAPSQLFVCFLPNVDDQNHNFCYYSQHVSIWYFENQQFIVSHVHILSKMSLNRCLPTFTNMDFLFHFATSKFVKRRFQPFKINWIWHLNIRDFDL